MTPQLSTLKVLPALAGTLLGLLAVGPASAQPATPGPATAKATGGGSIDVPGGWATFGLVAKVSAKGQPQGNFTFQDHVTGRMVKSVEVTGLAISGIHAEFWGKAVTDGNSDAEVDFVVDVDDVAEPGAGVDTFLLRLSNGYSAGVIGGSVPTGAASGVTLDGGNIQVRGLTDGIVGAPPPAFIAPPGGGIGTD
jgi:hypothetical protein